MVKEEYKSIAGAAEFVGLSRGYIWKQVRSGAIRAMRVGENYIIPHSEVMRVRQNRLEQLEKQIEALKGTRKAA